MPQTRARELLAWFQQHQDEMINFIRHLVALESPSDVPAAQQPVFDLLSQELKKIDYRIIRIPGRLSGGHLYARPTKRIRKKPVQLLIGHCDTVWPVGTIDTMPVEFKSGRLHGPGIYDMKTGLTQMIYVLKALKAIQHEPEVTPILFVNSDEEVGSKESSRYIHRLARVANRSFVLEPSMGPTGQIKTARKGIGRFTITVRGKAAHAGLDPEGGASAILELSHVIQKLFELNDIDKGITVNVGMIDGGLRPNVIAPVSTAISDVRVLTQRDAEHIEQAIYNIQPATPGVKLEIEGKIGRPPLEKTSANRKLWKVAVQLAQQLDLQLEEGTAGGGSDGNTTSLYSATLDGLGAVGDGAHAVHEHIDPSKLPERSALLALLVLSPALHQS
ncbi:glutamate carboxypeptidase [Nitrosomonas aestuarii]|uniref:Glutamate carboxypeptidase n=1 Tax=Nitrosomonas aestuarii TaxID=52441 RepID=A0A1I4CQL9_9PROT|nr:M20 family metallopeptidase [Nitrosomonas aestuarii]SFK83552.1 glutamate carboxypeptidase [Nitrosomonas aestuarii]